MSFDARVAGIPDFLAHVKVSLGKDEAQFQQRKFDAAKDALNAMRDVEFSKKDVSRLLKEKSEPQTHVYFERHGFLEPLQKWAANRDGTTLEAVREDNAWTDYLHLALLGSNDALVMPLDFNVPATVEVEGRAFPLMVVSAPRLLEELERANGVLNVEHSMRNHELPPFMQAKREEVERLEHVECLDEGFWIKFALIALRQLALVADTLDLPLIIEPRAVPTD